MKASRLASSALLALGAFALLGAVALVIYARQSPHQSLEDLGLFVGGLLLGAASGIASGLGLLVASAGRHKLPRAVIAIAALAALVSVVAGVAFVQTAWESMNVGLLALSAAAILVAGGGLVAAPRVWPRAA